MKFKTRPTQINLHDIRKAIQIPIQERKDRGVYEHFDLSRVIAYELMDLKQHEARLTPLLKALSHSFAIDITDFNIPVKSGNRGRLELSVKKVIWKLLKFYTYRLFHQQREFNSQLNNAVHYLQLTYEREIGLLRDQIQKLEKE